MGPEREQLILDKKTRKKKEKMSYRQQGAPVKKKVNFEKDVRSNSGKQSSVHTVKYDLCPKPSIQ